MMLQKCKPFQTSYIMNMAQVLTTVAVGRIGNVIIQFEKESNFVVSCSRTIFKNCPRLRIKVFHLLASNDDLGLMYPFL